MQERSKDYSRILSAVRFTPDGLVPVIVQQFNTHEILMMAWMNRDAMEETLEKKRMCYWSRSRKSLWRKGETSGQWQELKRIMLDCDGDVLLAEVDQKGGGDVPGVACHTGRRSCFYREIKGEEWIENQPVLNPKMV